MQASSKTSKPTAEAKQRYTVREVSGIGIGAGAFVVVDNDDGSEWGTTLWRDEAEKLARRWNDREADATGEQP